MHVYKTTPKECALSKSTPHKPALSVLHTDLRTSYLALGAVRLLLRSLGRADRVRKPVEPLEQTVAHCGAARLDVPPPML